MTLTPTNACATLCLSAEKAGRRGESRQVGNRPSLKRGESALADLSPPPVSHELAGSPFYKEGFLMIIPKAVHHIVCDELGLSQDKQHSHFEICQAISKQTGCHIPNDKKKRKKLILRYLREHNLFHRTLSRGCKEADASTCCVYVVQQSGFKQPIKVGASRSLRKRLETLQTGSHCELVIVGVILARDWEHALDIERHMHELLDEFRLTGEWFSRRALKVLTRLGVITVSRPTAHVSMDEIG